MTVPASIPPLRPETEDDALARLLHPGRYYDTPADVIADASLTVPERRAILSSWASDACAVESCPSLRQPNFFSHPVSFDDIMDALMQLDRFGTVEGLSQRRDTDDPRTAGF